MLMAIKEQRLVSLVYAVTIDPKFTTTLIARDVRSSYGLERLKIGRSIKTNFIIAHGTCLRQYFRTQILLCFPQSSITLVLDYFPLGQIMSFGGWAFRSKNSNASISFLYIELFYLGPLIGHRY